MSDYSSMKHFNAAVTIQSAFRGWYERFPEELLKVNRLIYIQKIYRGWLCRKTILKENIMSKKIYKHY